MMQRFSLRLAQNVTPQYYDIDSKRLLGIEYYAIAKYENNTGVNLFSIDEHFNVIDGSYFANVEETMYELEPDGISLKDWNKVLCKCNK